MIKAIKIVIIVFLINNISISAQVYFKGDINNSSKNISRTIIITDYNKLSFENIRVYKNYMYYFYKDTITNDYNFSIPLSTPSILEFQVDNVVNYVYAIPGDTIQFKIKYTDDLSPSESAIKKWSLFSERDTLLKSCTILYTGNREKENTFLNFLQKKDGLIRFSRQKFSKDFDLINYREQEVNNIYTDQLNELKRFCDYNTELEFYILTKELIEADFVQNIIAPVYYFHYKKEIPANYFSKPALTHIKSIVNQKSKSYYLRFAKWQLNEGFFNDSLFNKKSEEQFVSRYNSCKSIFRESNDFDLIASLIINDMIFRNILDDSIINDYAKNCSNQLWVENILRNYTNRNTQSMKIRNNFLDIINLDTIFNTQRQVVNILSLLPKNKFILLDFWATWCKPCLKNTPYLISAVNNDTLFKNIIVLNMSFDFNVAQWINAVNYGKSENDFSIVRQFFVKNNFKSHIAQSLSINGIPRYVLIAPDFKIINTDLPQPKEEKEFLRQIKKGIESYYSNMRITHL